MSTSKMCLSILFSIVALQLWSQSFNTMTISSPENIAGDYIIASAGFGPQPDDDFIGSLSIVIDTDGPFTDACSSITNEISNSIALVDRGACQFGVKATNVESAGAVAMLVCNNQEGDPEVMQDGEFGDMVNIYSAMARMDDCEKIKIALQTEAVIVNFSYIEPPCEFEYDSSYVWGVQGEGSFDNGLGDWETIGISGEGHVFSYSLTSMGQGALTTSQYILASPTACNGSAILDFDFLTTQGDQDILQNLELPYPTYSAELISPSIDLSNHENLVVEFYYYYIQLNGVATFSYSIDDGETWSNGIELKAGYSPSIDASPKTEKFEMAIDELNNQENIKLKITSHENDFYILTIDDFAIRTGGADVISATTNTDNKNDFLIYPNPTSGDIELRFSNDMKFKSGLLQMFDMQGRNVYEKKIDNPSKMSIATNGLPTGIYSLVFQTNTGTYRQTVHIN